MWLLSLCLGLSFSGCSIHSQRNLVPPAYLEISTDSRVILTRALNVTPGEAGVYLQNGQVTSGNQLDRYHPNCRLQLRQISETVQTIEAGAFQVIKVSHIEELVAAEVIKLAAVGIFSMFGDSYMENYVTILKLRAVERSQTVKLLCQHWEDATDANHLTLKQIRDALGDIMEIQISKQ